MATKLNIYDIGTNDLTNLIATLDAQRADFEALSLSNMENTSAPQILQGSIWNVAGSVYYSSIDETPSGTPVTGFNYIKGVVSGSTLTYTWTTTAPTWDPEKGGWYGTGGAADDRYLPYKFAVSGAVYLKQRMLSREILNMLNFSNDGLQIGQEKSAVDIAIGDSTLRLSWDQAGTDKLELIGKGLKAEEDSEFNQNLDVDGDLVVGGTAQHDARRFETSSSNIFIATPSSGTQNELFDLLAPFIPTIGDYMSIHGTEYYSDTATDWRQYHYAYRETATRIRIHGVLMRWTTVFSTSALNRQINDGSSSFILVGLADADMMITW